MALVSYLTDTHFYCPFYMFFTSFFNAFVVFFSLPVFCFVRFVCFVVVVVECRLFMTGLAAFFRSGY